MTKKNEAIVGAVLVGGAIAVTAMDVIRERIADRVRTKELKQNAARELETTVRVAVLIEDRIQKGYYKGRLTPERIKNDAAFERAMLERDIKG